MKRTIPAIFAFIALFAPWAHAAVADVTGLVPTIWWDFETKPNASGLPTSNKGSASISFSNEGTVAYVAGATNGWALNTASFTPYSAAGTFSTAGGAFTISLVMNLGTNPNGITLNVRSTAGDLVIRRGSDIGSLVVGFGPQKAVSSQFLNATFPNGDADWHLVSVVAGPTGTGLYMDGVLVDSTANTTLWSASGVLSQMQFGSHLNGAQTGEAKFGGCIDDLRIHDAALTTGQMTAIAAECGLSTDSFISVRATGEPTVGTNSFSTAWTLFLDANSTADAALVHGTDAALSSPTTNALGSALAPGSRTATLTGLSPDTAYWWKIVASNGVDWAETPVASFRTRAVLAVTDFAKRIPITVSGYAGASALTNFPVLVALAAGSPAGFDYAECAAGGADLRFADADGVALPHEIDTWDTNGMSYVWVGLPVVANGTTFAMYYGSANPGTATATDVWKPYVGVWHMGEASGAVADATGHALDATPAGNTANSIALADGPVGNARQTATSAAKGYLSIPAYDLFALGGTFTMSGWVKLAGVTAYPRLFSRKAKYTDANGWEIEMSNGSTTAFGARGSGNTPSYSGTLGSALKDAWSHVVLVYDGATLTVYQNGVQVKTGAITAATDNGLPLSIGCNSNGSETYAQGAFDECRLLGGAASADWVKACYDTMAAPASFLALSPAESTDVALPRFGALAASDENGTATFSVALAVPGYGGAVPTAVSVFYGTDGETWTELSLGVTNAASTLTGSASGLAGNVRVLWYATATATQGGVPKTMTSPQQSFVTKALEPMGDYKSFTATVDWDGAAAENIPVLVRISEPAIRGFDYGDVTASGLEILDSSDHLLPYEIDTWNTNGESLVWVLLPDYRDGASFTVRYGTAFANARPPAADVWAGYVGVWHMNEILEDPATGNHYTPDSSASGWHAYKAVDGDSVPAPVTTAAGVTAHPTPITGTAMNIAYGAGKSDSSVCGFIVPASATAGTTLDGPGFTLSAIVNSQQNANDGRCRAIAFGNAYNDRANLSVGKDNIYCMGANSHNKPNPKGSTGWVCATAIFGSPSFLYADGENISGAGGGNPNLTSLALDKGIGLGCFTDGKQCLNGYLDEVRIRNASSTAAYIAAEYHAMADDAALVLSVVSSSDTTAPVLGVPSVARNPDGSFTVSVEVSENAPASIFCAIGGTDYAMTASGGSLPATYAAVVSGLPGGTYTTTVRATGSGGTTVSSACPTVFHAGALAVEVLSDADEGTLAPGAFRISRLDADPAGLPALAFDVAFSGDGLAVVVPPAVFSLTIPAGEGHVDFAVTPIYAPEVDVDTEVVLTASGTNIGLPSSNAMAVVNADYDPAVRFVATDGDDANHGGTPELPKKTIRAAVASLDYVAQTMVSTVHVAPGLYPISSPIEFARAIRVLGSDADPSRTVVSNTFTVNWNNQNKRVFMLNHADALVANLTMQKGQYYYGASGGNFYIGTAGGMVSNCVVEAGVTSGNAAAGGGWLDGGMVTHSVFRRNKCDSGSANWSTSRAGVLELQNSARAENCLFDDNSQTKNVVLMRLDGKSVMRNCTIVNSALAVTNADCAAWSALQIASGATAQNVVIAGVTNRVDGAPCPPTWTKTQFLNGAFDGNATGLPGGTVTGAKTSFFRNWAARDYRPALGGPLTGKGANYEGMAAVDLSGRQKRLIGKQIDIGAYEANTANTVLILK